MNKQHIFIIIIDSQMSRIDFLKISKHVNGTEKVELSCEGSTAPGQASTRTRLEFVFKKAVALTFLM